MKKEITTVQSVLTVVSSGLISTAYSTQLKASHCCCVTGAKICGKDESTALAIDPTVERERRYDALADHYRNNLKMDHIYRALDRQ
jgi:hypothetical protein